MAAFSSQDFHDQLAEDHHLIYEDWSLSVSRQGDVLDALARRYLDGAGPLDVLDCCCGIGTQAIGLAERGHRVVGSDLSPVAASRAAGKARQRGLALTTFAADMRSPPFADASFDVVLSADNSLAHLLTRDDVRRTLRGMRRIVRSGAVLVLTAKDYGDARQPRRHATVPQVTDSDAGQVVTFQLWHWHDDEIYDFDHV
jgi:SAM-dependent methyltransferase